MSDFITCASVTKPYDISPTSKDIVTFTANDFVYNDGVIFSPPILTVKIEKQGADHKISLMPGCVPRPHAPIINEYTYKITSQNNSNISAIIKSQDPGISVTTFPHREFIGYMSPDNTTKVMIPGSGRTIVTVVNIPNGLVERNEAVDSDIYIIDIYGCSVNSITGDIAYNYASVKVMRNNSVHPSLIDKSIIIENQVPSKSIHSYPIYPNANILSSSYPNNILTRESFMLSINHNVVKNINDTKGAAENTKTFIGTINASSPFPHENNANIRGITETTKNVTEKAGENTKEIAFVEESIENVKCSEIRDVWINPYLDNDILDPTVIPKLKPSNHVRIPDLVIRTRDNIGSTDIGEVCFIVQDQYDYERHKITDNTSRLRWIDPSNIKISKFRRCSPYIAPFLRGEGETARQKAGYIWTKENLSKTITERDFYSRLIIYAMLKYILCRILYGKFDMSLLFTELHFKFIEDLNRSRFCVIAEKFNDPTSEIYGYEKYFLWTE
jgi:hypothetical protein